MTNKGRRNKQTGSLKPLPQDPKTQDKKMKKKKKPGQNSQRFSLLSSLAHFNVLTKPGMLYLLPGVGEATSPIATENSYPF